MAGITLEIAEARLTKYLNAEEKILLGQSANLDGQMLTRADLVAVQQGIAIWQGRVARLANSGRLRVVEVIPR